MRTLAHFTLWNLRLARAETQTSDAERDCLARRASGRRRVVEVGVWHGVTTRRLRAVMSRNGLLYAVDPFPPGRLGFSMQRLIAQREVANVAGGRVEWIRMAGHDAARVVAKSGAVDFIFIDGDHSWEGIEIDWSAWSRLVSPCGIVALHDSVSSRARNIESAGSARFTRDVVSKDPRFVLVETVDTLTVWERTNESPSGSLTAG